MDGGSKEGWTPMLASGPLACAALRSGGGSVAAAPGCMRTTKPPAPEGSGTSSKYSSKRLTMSISLRFLYSTSFFNCATRKSEPSCDKVTALPLYWISMAWYMAVAMLRSFVRSRSLAAWMLGVHTRSWNRPSLPKGAWAFATMEFQAVASGMALPAMAAQAAASLLPMPNVAPLGGVMVGNPGFMDLSSSRISRWTLASWSSTAESGNDPLASVFCRLA
mmetsp:Transcript_127934/g.409875  ORF Transcript_127934/g.409875 Transcript_127934/m.409875 type:complete len:220 (-) Transcript_127934:623-1282(-)